MKVTHVMVMTRTIYNRPLHVIVYDTCNGYDKDNCMGLIIYIEIAREKVK